MTPPVDTLGPLEFLEAMATASRVLEDHAAALDELGGPGTASPAANGGVGSDLAATFSAAVSLADRSTDFSSISAALGEGAREAGNSAVGRRVAMLFDGMGEVLRNADRLDAERFALALEAGVEKLTPADDGKHPGGFAAVAGVAADAALSELDRGADLGETILAAAGAGIEELERGPECDPRLAARGTVDPGAAGLLLVLDTLASVVTGEPLPERPDTSAGPVAARDPAVLYDVRCRLIPDRPADDAAGELASVLEQVAEILTWETDGDTWTVGVRSAVPGAVVEALVEVGAPREVHIGLASGASTSGRSVTGPLVGYAG